MTKTSIAVLGIDLGKNSCSLAALDAGGAVVWRRRMTREGVVTFVSKLPVCIVAMEACCDAHFLGRAFQARSCSSAGSSCPSAVALCGSGWTSS